MNRLFCFVVVIMLTIIIESCGSKPEPLPAAKPKPKKKPDWITRKKIDIDTWYGVGSMAIGDSLDYEAIAKDLIKSQIQNQIKKIIKNEIDLSDEKLGNITNDILKSRMKVINKLVKKEDTYNDGVKKYLLLSLNKSDYLNFLQNKFDGYDLDKVISSIKGLPSKENFLLLSKAIRISVELIDHIIKEDEKVKESKDKTLNQLAYIINDYNERIEFILNPKFLSSVPIMNENEEINIGLIDNVSSKKLDSIDVLLDYASEFDAGHWVSDSANDLSMILPVSPSGSSYSLSLGVDYDKILQGDYLPLFSIKPANYKITIMPKNVTIYSTESISSLGTGLEYSAIYDSIKSCFGDNYGVQFVSDINDSDLLMSIEVTAKENMRRESRKQPFKSEAFFILNLKYRESGNILISHIIAKSEALDYDFVERASIKALRELANKSIDVICQ